MATQNATIMTRLKENVMEESEKVSATGPKVVDLYKLKTTSKEISKHVSTKEIKGCHYRPDEMPDETKVIMLVGGTGTGKTTLINRIANHWLGVEYNDNYRFELIPVQEVGEQTKSQTKEITIYKFAKNEAFQFNLSIIDTPGFGDTSGKGSDSKTVKMIKELFDSGKILTLHLIGFVVKHNDVRLTNQQRYVFQSVVKIFGENVENIICVMATHCDDIDPNTVPPAIKALESEKVPYAIILKYNNRQTFTKNPLQEIFWKMSSESCETLLTEVENAQPVSLELSQEILHQHKSAQIKLQCVSTKVKDGLLKVQELIADQQAVDTKKTEIEKNSKFEYNAKQVVTKEVEIKKEGVVAIWCKICDTVCHYPCTLGNRKIVWCHAMSRFNRQWRVYCTVCDRECSWKDHHARNKIVKSTLEVVVKTNEDLKQKYDVLVTDKNTYQELYKRVEKEITDTYGKLMIHLLEMKKNIDFINTNGLLAKTGFVLTVQKHIEKLINSESKSRDEGFDKRMKCYQELIEIADKPKNFKQLTESEKTEEAKAFFLKCS